MGTVTHCNSRGEPLGKEHFTEDGRLIVPHDTPVGRRVYEKFKRFAAHMCEVGEEATKDFMLANFPTAQTIRKEYKDRQYRRVIEAVDGEHVMAYDFTTKTVFSALAATIPANETSAAAV